MISGVESGAQIAAIDAMDSKNAAETMELIKDGMSIIRTIVQHSTNFPRNSTSDRSLARVLIDDTLSLSGGGG